MKLAVLCVLTFGFTLSDHFHPTESSIIPSNNDWISFQRKHILNPGKVSYVRRRILHIEKANFVLIPSVEIIFKDEEEPDFYDWKARQWRKWFFRRRPEAHPSAQQSLNAYYGKFAPFMTLKLKEVVVISRPEEVAAAFRGNLMQVKRTKMIWPRSSLPKYGRLMRIYVCLSMELKTRLWYGAHGLFLLLFSKKLEEDCVSLTVEKCLLRLDCLTAILRIFMIFIPSISEIPSEDF